ncbi:hypothetical protein AB0C04_29410 [Micromonospora sp. NPDC048909]|uniref:hypothetical protein n=1 Tax=Micromonospora sp. NPDC048909 TaxID=3155643 RepID=UPI0033ED270E
MTDAEMAFQRPDLPFAVAQSEVLSWPAEAPGSIEASARRWRSAGCPRAETLAASELYLYPFGPRGGERAGVRVKADNRDSFG